MMKRNHQMETTPGGETVSIHEETGVPGCMEYRDSHVGMW